MSTRKFQPARRPSADAITPERARPTCEKANSFFSRVNKNCIFSCLHRTLKRSIGRVQGRILMSIAYQSFTTRLRAPRRHPKGVKKDKVLGGRFMARPVHPFRCKWFFNYFNWLWISRRVCGNGQFGVYNAAAWVISIKRAFDSSSNLRGTYASAVPSACRCNILPFLQRSSWRRRTPGRRFRPQPLENFYFNGKLK